MLIIIAAFVIVVGAWIAKTMVFAFARACADLVRLRPRALQATPHEPAAASPRVLYPAAGPPSPRSALKLPRSVVLQACEQSGPSDELRLDKLIDSQEFRQSGMAMPIALGLGQNGSPIVMDIAAAPHILVGGTTGSGKSVMQHALVISLLSAHGPRTLRLLLVDTKGLELTAYNGLPHLRHRVVTSATEALDVLRWAAVEISARAALLRVNGCRHVGEFNDLVRDGGAVLQQPLRPSAACDESSPETSAYLGDVIPFLVLVIDDLADIGAAQGSTHAILSTVAQSGRATGVHLVCVTQRPSATIVAGDAKALFPTRIAFRLPAAVDSRIVLDRAGAERLAGAGMMIVVSSNAPKGLPVRGVPVSNEVVDAIVPYYASQAQNESSLFPIERDIISELRESDALAASTLAQTLNADARDPLFREAAELCIQNQSGSTSLLQRRLGIGYGRAARVIDQLAEAGVLDTRSGPRGWEVRGGLEDLDRICGVRG